MAFKPGHSKFGGRKKGTSDVIVQTAREMFVAILEGQVIYIDEAFEKVREKDPVKYLELYSKFAQYFIPRKIDLTVDNHQLTPAPIQLLPPNEDHAGA